MPAVALSADKVVGFREKKGVHVGSGTVTETDNVIIGDGGEFYKTGAGTYVLPGAKLNQQRPMNLVVTDGTLKLQAGADETVDVSTPPDVMSEAAFWVDAGANVVTEESAGATRVTRWCDVRETNTDSPTMGYAVPAWLSADSGFATHYNIKPEYVTKDGNKAVYFGGAKSGQYMNFVTAAGANRTLSRVKHAFVVHGVYECLGAVIGGRSQNHGMWLRWKADGLITVADLRTLKSHVEDYRSDMAPMMMVAQWYLDGRHIDISREMPELGKFQLLAADWPTKEISVSCFYNQQGLCHSTGESTSRGGDYLAEAVFFERQLSEAERIAVESYLMKKWNVGADKLAKGQVPVDPAQPSGATFFTNGIWTARLSGNVAIAKGATFAVDAVAGTRSPIVSLTGEGSVVKTGEGSLQIGTQKGAAFTGDIELREGTIDVRGGAYPILKAVAGKRVTASASGNLVLMNCPTNQFESSAQYSVQNGKAGEFRKDGAEPLAVSKIDGDVKNLSVDQGLLKLVGPRSVAAVDDTKTLAATDLHVNIVDPGFEYVTTTNLIYYGHTARLADLSGWTKTSGGGADYGVRYLLARHDGTVLPDYDASNWNFWISRKPVEGNNCIKLDSQFGYATLKQELLFNNAGRYTLSFYMISMSNKSWDFTQQPLRVKLDDRVVGYAFAGIYGWLRCYIDLGEVSAGSHTLAFSYDERECPSLICLDDVRVDFAGTKRNVSADYAIPYGDFEEWESSSSYYPYVGEYNHAKGWSLASTDASLSNHKFPVFVATDASRFPANEDGSSFSTERLFSIRAMDTTGCSYLAFIGDCGRASTTFTAPKGVWFLKARMAQSKGRFLKVSEYKNLALRATLERADGSSVNLGTVTAASFVFEDVVWPTWVKFDEEEEVTLTLESLNKSMGAIDDLRLGYADVNLVKNGGFEQGGWLAEWSSCADRSTYANAGVSQLDTAADGEWNGRNNGFCGYEGKCVALLMNTSTLYQDIDFPEAGYYRLSFAVRSRVRVNELGRNMLTFWHGGDDMDAITTNRIVQVHPNTMNFIEHSYLFYVPSSGLRRIGVSGEGNVLEPGSECKSAVDAISIVRALDVEEDEVPLVPEEMNLSVAEGAMLNLDFLGTLKCGVVRLGGKVAYGLVNAHTHPQYVTGTGSIMSTPNGFIISFR